jgi:hypothetical protein
MDSARTPELIHAEPMDVSKPHSEIRFLRHPIKLPSMADLRTQVMASTSGVALAFRASVFVTKKVAKSVVK